jgi:hypothetical protein
MPDIETNAALGIAGNTQGNMMGSHNFLGGMAVRGTRNLRRGISQGRQFKQKDKLQKAMYENEAILASHRSKLKREELEYGSNLKRGEATQQADILDWHSAQAPEHITNTIKAAREASVYEDENGNRLGEIAYKGRTAAGVETQTGGYTLPVRKPEEKPHAQGQQMRQTFLGVYKDPEDEEGKEYPLANIPTLTSENSTIGDNGQITSVGWTRRNPTNNSFEENVGPKDNFEQQQSVQRHGN